jgi:hypothetical protein
VKLSGKVDFVDVGSGAFVLVADDGQRYQLAGGDRGMKKAGQRIEVEGDVDAGAVTAAMAGPVLRVKSYRAI